jgi:hypothetical protein
LNVIVVLDCPEEVPVIMEPPLVGVAVAVYDNAPVTEEKVTVVSVEEEEEALTSVGAVRGVTGFDSAGREVCDVVLFVATTVNVYVVPGVNPLTVMGMVEDCAVDVPVKLPGVEVAVYKVAPYTSSTVTVADVEDVEETLDIVGVARVNMKGVSEELILVQIEPTPG